MAQSIREDMGMLLNESTLAGTRYDCAAQKGRYIDLTRETHWDPDSGKDFPAVSVHLGDRLLTTFPAVHRGNLHSAPARITRRVYLDDLPGTAISPIQLRLRVSSGRNVIEEVPAIELGEFSFKASWDGARWQPFSKPGEKTPFGVFDHVYLYQGPLGLGPETALFEPYPCADQDPNPVLRRKALDDVPSF